MIPAGPHTPWPNRAEMCVRLYKKSSSRHSWTQRPRIWTEYSVTHHTFQVDAQSSDGEITQVSLNGETPLDLAIGRRPRDFMDFASMNPEHLTSTPTKQDLLNENIQKLVMKTNSEVQQREDIRRDLTEGMIFVLPGLRLGEQVF